MKKLFIPEKFVGKSAIITHVWKHGWGLVVDQDKLGDSIKEGRVHHEVLLAQAFIPLPEEK